MTPSETYLWVAGAALVAAVVLAVWVAVRKGRPFTTGDVFRASRWSTGNRLFPTQVAITAGVVDLAAGHDESHPRQSTGADPPVIMRG